MPAFLSREWVELLDATLRAELPEGVLAPGAGLVVEQRVPDAPGGLLDRYHVVLVPGGASAAPGPAPAPDLVLTADVQTATLIARGESNAQRALSAGRLRVGGRPDRLAGVGPALVALGDVLGRVRRATDFPAAT